MTFYEGVAIVAFIGLLLVPSNMQRYGNATGSLILAIVWPTMLVAVVYYLTKKLLGRPGVSRRYGDVEMVVCLLGGCLSIPLVLYLMHDPWAVMVVHSFRS